MLIVLALVVASAALAPLLGADTRDGLDWARGNFWLRRRPRPESIRTSDSPESASAAPAAAAGCRTVPAAG